MAETKLTARKEIVLRFLANWEFESPPDGPEISEYTRNPREWATPTLIALEKRGLVERLGKSVNNAWCWRVTEKGREALRQTQGSGS